MADTVGKVAAALAGDLQPGERVVAATKAQVLGGTMKMAKLTGLTVGIGGLVGAAAAAAVDPGGDDVGKRLAAGAAVAVTDRRLLVLSVTKLGANPKDLVLSVDRAQVSGVEEGTTRAAMVKMATFTVQVAESAAGEPVELGFEVPKVATKDAAAVVAELRR